MRSDDKLKLAKKHQEIAETKTTIISEAKAITAYTQQRKVELAEIKKSIESLADALDVSVNFPDIAPLLEKLATLESLPDSFLDIKNMSLAISNKLQLLVEYFQKRQIITVRGFAEASQRWEDISKNIEKFADLPTYLDQLAETLKQGQEPEDFKPVRIVIGGGGTKLDFLKQFPTSRGGGGGASSIAGVWGYHAGTSGTLVMSGDKRVLRITAIALGAAGSLTINGGDTITIPYDTTDSTSSSITIEPVANLTDPTIVFTGTDAYMVEYVA